MISVQRRAAVVGAVDAAVVLLVERLGLAGRRDELVDALAELGRRAGHEVGADAAVARRPGAPPSRVSKVPTAEIPTHIRRGSVAWGTIVWRISPPLPGCQSGRDGMLRQAGDVRPGRAAVVAPEEARRLHAGEDRRRGPRSRSRPSGSPGRRRRTSGPPRSASRSRRGRPSARPPGRTRGSRPRRRSLLLAASTLTSWTGQPSHIGPRSDQVRRSASDSAMNAPLRVPTSSSTRVAIPVPPSCRHRSGDRAMVPRSAQTMVHDGLSEIRERAVPRGASARPTRLPSEGLFLARRSSPRGLAVARLARIRCGVLSVGPIGHSHDRSR